MRYVTVRDFCDLSVVLVDDVWCIFLMIPMNFGKMVFESAKTSAQTKC